METEKITVIVPIYKVEAYLKDCVDSILAQTYQNLEIILVDDESPDGCPAICDAYAAKDARVRVIHQKNRGLSGARNAGLDIATGQYIGFVDSDDRIYPDMYSRLHRLLVDNSADMAQCDAAVSGIDPGPEKPETVTTIPGGDTLWEAAINDRLAWTVWCNLYRAEIWQTLRFDEGFYYEDVLAFPGIAARVNLFVKTSQKLYYYNRREEGILRSEKNLCHLRSKEKMYARCAEVFAEKPALGAAGAYYLCKNIPAWRMQIRPGKSISAQQAAAHNKKMHALFRSQYSAAKTYAGYRASSRMKKLLWAVYALSPRLEATLLWLYKKDA